MAAAKDLGTSSHRCGTVDGVPDLVRQPSINELGRDLLRVSRWDLLVVTGRPILCFASYWLFARVGWWPAAVLAVAGLQFFTYVSASHDLAHRTLRLPRTLNEALLALFEGLALRSGHAFRITHLHHHRCVAGESDIEARGATGTFWRALLCGPGYQLRLFLWAWQKARVRERCWMACEAAGACVFVLMAFLCRNWSPQPGIYVLLVTASAWLYPVATVWWPHRAPGNLPLARTRAFRGRFAPALLFHHTYHLEHHLYPMVPVQHWPVLARRLDPYLRECGVKAVRLP